MQGERKPISREKNEELLRSSATSQDEEDEESQSEGEERQIGGDHAQVEGSEEKAIPSSSRKRKQQEPEENSSKGEEEDEEEDEESVEELASTNAKKSKILNTTVNLRDDKEVSDFLDKVEKRLNDSKVKTGTSEWENYKREFARFLKSKKRQKSTNLHIKTNYLHGLLFLKSEDFNYLKKSLNKFEEGFSPREVKNEQGTFYKGQCAAKALEIIFKKNRCLLPQVKKNNICEYANYIIKNHKNINEIGIAYYALAYANGDKDECYIENLRKAYNKNINLSFPIDIRHDLANIHFKKNEYKNAVNYFINKENLTKKSKFLLGKSLYFLKKNTEAAEVLKDFISSESPYCLDANYYYGASLLDECQKGEVNDKIFSSLKKSITENSDALYQLGLAYLKKGMSLANVHEALNWFFAYLLKEKAKAYRSECLLKIALIYLSNMDGMNTSHSQAFFYLSLWLNENNNKSKEDIANLVVDKQLKIKILKLCKYRKPEWKDIHQEDKSVQADVVRNYLAQHDNKLNGNQLSELLELTKVNNSPRLNFLYACAVKKNESITKALPLYEKVACLEPNDECNVADLFFIAEAITFFCEKSSALLASKAENYMKKAMALYLDCAEQGSKESLEILVKIIKNRNREEDKYILLTKLLYRSHRHLWENSRCEILRILLITLGESKASLKNQKALCEYLEGIEKSKHTFYGEELSSDSDDEEEQKFQRLSKAVREDSIATAYDRSLQAQRELMKKYLEKIHISEISSIKELKKKNKKTKDDSKAEAKSGNNKVQAGDSRILTNELIPHHLFSANEQEKRDLALLNLIKREKKGELKAEFVSKITTKFRVLLFRGETYYINRWNQDSRRKHRKHADEKTIDNQVTSFPVYSAAVYTAAGVRLDKGLTECSPQELARLKDEGNKLRNQLMSLNKRQWGKKDGAPIEFRSEGDYLQHVFTSSYKKFNDLMKNQYKKWDFLNPDMPKIATGSIPRHAALYAYGIKPYKGDDDKRLRPRWRHDGRAERPKSGKVKVFFCHPADFSIEKEPMHVISMTNLQRICIHYLMLHEHEITFPGFIEADRVVDSQVAKYPSFTGDYKDIFLIKYGIDKPFFLLFKAILAKYPPHSNQNKVAKAVLGEYLASYSNLRLFYIAHYKALALGVKLVFINEHGDFSFTPARVLSGNSKHDQEIRRLYQGVFAQAGAAPAKPSDEMEDSEKAESDDSMQLGR